MCEQLKSEFQLCEEIGRGRYGVVYRCFDPASGQYLACKSVSKDRLTDETDRDCIEKEPKILQILSSTHHHHQNILRVHRVFEDEGYLHMVTDLCEGPDLFDRISGHGRPFTEPEAARILRPLVSAISYCHRMGIAHRDIKPDNIMFGPDGELKVCDFGSADWFGANEGFVMSGVVGTPYYVAPEVLSGREYTEKVDVWSCGVILYLLLAGFPPFYGDTPVETFDAVMRGNLRFPTRVFRSVSSEAKDLMRKMMCKDPSRRLSADQVLRHPWVINGGVTGSLADMT